MNSQATDIIRVTFEAGYFLVRVVVEYANLRVVRACYDPIFACNELGSANCAFLVRIDCHVAT